MMKRAAECARQNRYIQRKFGVAGVQLQLQEEEDEAGRWTLRAWLRSSHAAACGL